MKRHLAYLKYVLRHKWYVFQACRLPLLSVPLWVAFWHDWDKFLPSEWRGYVACFYKPDGTKQYEEKYLLAAWMRHQHINKHHWQWWLTCGQTPIQRTNILVMDRGQAFILTEYKNANGTPKFFEWNGDITPRPMSGLAIREMIADWIGAGKATGATLTTPQWYDVNKHRIKLHPDTRRVVEGLLDHLR